MSLTRNQIYRRRRLAVFSTIGIIVGSLVYLPMTLLAPVAPATAVVQPYTVEPSAAPQIAVPSYGASLIVADGYGTLAQGGSDGPLPMASITKLITSLVVLEAHPLAAGENGPVVTTTAQDVAIYDRYVRANGSVQPVSSGLAFTQHELMQLVLIESANNYAETLVNWAFGSQEAYLATARDWLAAQGLGGITIVDSTGISLENTASATDLITLAHLALQNPVIADIVSTRSIQMHDIGMLENSNPVLGEAEVTGLKTGTLLEFGYNLLFSATHHIGDTDIALYGVVLGAPSEARLTQDVLGLLQGATAGFQEVSLVEQGAVLAEYDTAWGESARLVADHAESVVVWGGTPVSVLVSGDPVTTGFAGDEAGIATFVVGDKTIQLPLVLDEDVAAPGAWWRLTNPMALL